MSGQQANVLKDLSVGKAFLLTRFAPSPGTFLTWLVVPTLHFLALGLVDIPDNWMISIWANLHACLLKQASRVCSSRSLLFFTRPYALQAVGYVLILGNQKGGIDRHAQLASQNYSLTGLLVLTNRNGKKLLGSYAFRHFACVEVCKLNDVVETCLEFKGVGLFQQSTLFGY